MTKQLNLAKLSFELENERVEKNIYTFSIDFSFCFHHLDRLVLDFDSKMLFKYEILLRKNLFRLEKFYDQSDIYF